MGHTALLVRGASGRAILAWMDPTEQNLQAMSNGTDIDPANFGQGTDPDAKASLCGQASQVALMEGLAGIGMLTGGLLVAALAPRRPVSWILLGLAASCTALAMTALVPSHLGIAWCGG